MRRRLSYFRPRFSLRVLLLSMTVAAVSLAAWLRWTDTPPVVGPCIGMIRMDVPLRFADRTALAHEVSENANVLGRHVVIVVPSLADVSRADALQIAGHARFAGNKPHVHFIECTSQDRASIRSFEPRWYLETGASREGALAAVMVLDQLHFRIPLEQRKPMGEDHAVRIDFPNGASLAVKYINDWGFFYLTGVSGPESLIASITPVDMKAFGGRKK